MVIVTIIILFIHCHACIFTHIEYTLTHGIDTHNVSLSLRHCWLPIRCHWLADTHTHIVIAGYTLLTHIVLLVTCCQECSKYMLVTHLLLLVNIWLLLAATQHTCWLAGCNSHHCHTQYCHCHIGFTQSHWSFVIVVVVASIAESLSSFEYVIGCINVSAGHRSVISLSVIRHTRHTHTQTHVRWHTSIPAVTGYLSLANVETHCYHVINIDTHWSSILAGRFMILLLAGHCHWLVTGHHQGYCWSSVITGHWLVSHRLTSSSSSSTHTHTDWSLTLLAVSTHTQHQFGLLSLHMKHYWFT
jgi:hypothetical protein